MPLSVIGAMVEKEIKNNSSFYEYVKTDQYCIMTDYIHMNLLIGVGGEKNNGRPQVAPTSSGIIQQLKRSITKKGSIQK
jgi:hypothetical protein